jgi:hypothetical protein
MPKWCAGCRYIRRQQKETISQSDFSEYQTVRRRNGELHDDVLSEDDLHDGGLSEDNLSEDDLDDGRTI